MLRRDGMAKGAVLKRSLREEETMRTLFLAMVLAFLTMACENKPQEPPQAPKLDYASMTDMEAFGAWLEPGDKSMIVGNIIRVGEDLVDVELGGAYPQTCEQLGWRNLFLAKPKGYFGTPDAWAYVLGIKGTACIPCMQVPQKACVMGPAQFVHRTALKNVPPNDRVEVYYSTRTSSLRLADPSESPTTDSPPSPAPAEGK
ncbi:MAG: hypothetical protein V1760_00880 [Candidatus Peregrinibacteria bacterium]